MMGLYEGWDRVGELANKWAKEEYDLSSWFLRESDGLDVYTIEEFWEAVDLGAFIPSDGVGYYARIDEEGEVVETEATVWEMPRRGRYFIADCVVWYNR